MFDTVFLHTVTMSRETFQSAENVHVLLALDRHETCSRIGCIESLVGEIVFSRNRYESLKGEKIVLSRYRDVAVVSVP